MTANEIDRFRRIELLFDGALEYPPGPERDAWLREQCATDAGMLADARRLLDGHERVSAAVPVEPEPLPQFGPWQAIRLLGRGGMGMVYLAERADGAFRMTVAVKVVPLALASVDIEERFRRERQFLASLDHPRIARLIDGGVTGAGLPYLAMEFVDGVAIDRFCDAQKLGARARVGMMRQVLEALSYVHGRQVIHRDLKASNILVDAAGNAKLLDFGTARLVDASGDAAITKSGVFAFTPECASPEQVQGKPLTFASDIYSAGVLLYRLLTGRGPYGLPDRSSDAIADTISHAEPEPSGLDAPLDAILSTALRKNPDERYASVAEMDADLARYLEGERVHARRPRKVAWIAVAAGVLALGGAVGWFVSRKANMKPPPSIAVLPFSNANNDAANQYLVDGMTAEIAGELAQLKTLRVASQASAALFRKQPRNIRNIGSRIKVSHLLEASVERSGDEVKIIASLDRTSDGARLWTNTYRRKASDIAGIEADLEYQIAASLGIAAPQRKKHVVSEQAHDFNLKGRYADNLGTVEGNSLAQQNYRRALELDPDYAAAYSNLGGALWNMNIYAGTRPDPAVRANALQLWQKAIRLDPSLPGPHILVGMYAMQYDWDWSRAEREFQAAITAGPSAGAESQLGFLYLILGKRSQADEHLRRARDLDPVSPAGINNTVQDLEMEERYAEARELVRNLVAQYPANLSYQSFLSVLDIRLGDVGPAMEKLRKLPDGNFELAWAEARIGRRDEALRLLRPFEQNFEKGRLPNFQFAIVYAAMDDEPNTVKWLERSLDAREGGAARIRIQPDFARFQNTPAFHVLKKRVNLDW